MRFRLLELGCELEQWNPSDSDFTSRDEERHASLAGAPTAASFASHENDAPFNSDERTLPRESPTGHGRLTTEEDVVLEDQSAISTDGSRISTPSVDRQDDAEFVSTQQSHELSTGTGKPDHAYIGYRWPMAGRCGDSRLPPVRCTPVVLYPYLPTTTNVCKLEINACSFVVVH